MKKVIASALAVLMLLGGTPLALGGVGGPGTVRVPNVVGMSGVKGAQLIAAAGLTSANSSQVVLVADSSKNGTVASQSPAKDTMARAGSTVTLTLYTYVAPNDSDAKGKVNLPRTVPAPADSDQKGTVKSLK